MMKFHFFMVPLLSSLVNTFPPTWMQHECSFCFVERKDVKKKGKSYIFEE